MVKSRVLIGAGRMTRTSLVIGALLALFGCEAPLDLQGVEQVSTAPVKRYDRFQAVARQGSALVAVGFNGAVLRSADDGGHWERIDLPGALDLIDVVACNDGNFVALDATRKVWVSADGGNLWESKVIDTADPVTTITCSPDSRIWVGGGFSSILSSDDGGETWMSTSMDEDAMFTSIQFLDESYGVASGEFGMVVVTRDGGESWEISGRIPGDFYPEATLFLDQDTGYAVGLDGKILTTADGGQSWEYEESGTDAPLYGITEHAGTLYVVGEGGIMLRRLEGRWEPVRHGLAVRSYLRSAMPVNDGQLLVAGGAGALFLVPTQN